MEYQFKASFVFISETFRPILAFSPFVFTIPVFISFVGAYLGSECNFLHEQNITGGYCKQIVQRVYMIVNNGYINCNHFGNFSQTIRSKCATK